MKLHHKIANLLGYDLFRQKSSHASYANHLAKILRSLDINLVLDVGANIGQFAKQLRQLGYTGEIISFEPIAHCVSYLESISAEDAKWKIYPFGLGNEAGEATLKVPDSNDFASLHDFNSYSAERFPRNISNIREEIVTINTLASWLCANPTLSGSNILLKIDTQGHDMQVLMGAGSKLHDFAAVSTELSFIPIYEQTPGYLTVLEFLETAGYAISGIYPVSRERGSLCLIEGDCIAVNRRRFRESSDRTSGLK